jgi:hypothetical protein
MMLNTIFIIRTNHQETTSIDYQGQFSRKSSRTLSETYNSFSDLDIIKSEIQIKLLKNNLSYGAFEWHYLVSLCKSIVISHRDYNINYNEDTVT